MIENIEEVARTVADESHGVQALRIKRLLLRKHAVAADGKLGDVGTCAWISCCAVRATLGIYATIQNIKEARSREQHRTPGIGATRSNWQTVDGYEIARVVIDLET